LFPAVSLLLIVCVFLHKKISPRAVTDVWNTELKKLLILASDVSSPTVQMWSYQLPLPPVQFVQERFPDSLHIPRFLASAEKYFEYNSANYFYERCFIR
jgi:hypothetical protein